MLMVCINIYNFYVVLFFPFPKTWAQNLEAHYSGRIFLDSIKACLAGRYCRRSLRWKWLNSAAPVLHNLLLSLSSPNPLSISAHLHALQLDFSLLAPPLVALFLSPPISLLFILPKLPALTGVIRSSCLKSKT